jgi:hypothetical protein
MAKVSNLPLEHPYIKDALAEIAQQLEPESLLVGGTSFMDLQREM